MVDVVLRCDADPRLGMGHLFRCRSLASALVRLGLECAMAGPSTRYRIRDDDACFAAWVQAPSWTGPEADAEWLLGMARGWEASFLVLDYYRVDEAYQRQLARAEAHWLQFERDPERPVLADLVVRGVPGARPTDFTAFVNPATRVLAGPEYAVLREQFELYSRRSTGSVQQVFVCFGAGDVRGALARVLPLMARAHPALAFVTVAGSANPELDSLRETIRELPNVNLEVDVVAVAERMASCDLAVVSGGMVSVEAAAVGLPMLIASIADNQLPQARGWAERGAAVDLGPLETVSDARLLAALNELITNADSIRDRLASRLRDVDGSGARRVAEAVRARVEELLHAEKPS